jgi:hypothetical protein
MVIRAKNRSTDAIIKDYLSSKARTDILGLDFTPTTQQVIELSRIIEEFGEYSLSRSRNHNGLSKKTLESVIPRLLKFNLDDFVGRLKRAEKLPSKNCWEYFLITYGKEEATKLWDAKAKKCSRSIESMGEENWNKWIDDRSGPILDKWKKKYGDEEGTRRFNDYSAKLSKGKSLEGYIERYGELLGRQKYQERYNNVNSAEYKTYARKVHRLSGKTYTENIDIINPNRYTRTLCGVEDGWQLDHIMPIKECFLKGISPEKASEVNNLRMLPWKENLMRNYDNTTNNHTA